MKDLESYKNEPDYTGSAKHEADSLLNRGGFVGVLRESAKGAARYWIFKVLIILILVGLGLGWQHGGKIASKLANYDFMGGADELAKTPLFAPHKVFKSSFAGDFEDWAKGERLKDVTKVVISNKRELLVTRKPFESMDAGSANMHCKAMFNQPFYAVSKKNYKDDYFLKLAWSGHSKFYCVILISKLL